MLSDQLIGLPPAPQQAAGASSVCHWSGGLGGRWEGVLGRTDPAEPLGCVLRRTQKVAADFFLFFFFFYGISKLLPVSILTPNHLHPTPSPPPRPPNSRYKDAALLDPRLALNHSVTRGRREALSIDCRSETRKQNAKSCVPGATGPWCVLRCDGNRTRLKGSQTVAASKTTTVPSVRAGGGRGDSQSESSFARSLTRTYTHMHTQ